MGGRFLGLSATACLLAGLTGCPPSGSVWSSLPLTCASELTTRSSSIQMGESGETETVTSCDAASAAILSDERTYLFSTSDGAASSATPAVNIMLVHSARIEGRGPLAAPNVHASRGGYRFVVPADQDGGTTNVRFQAADRWENAIAATGLSSSLVLQVYDSELELVLNVSPEAAAGVVHALAPGEYHVLAEASTTYDGLAIAEGSAASPLLRRTVSFRATVREADLPRSARDFADQKCSVARCPDVMGHWVLNLRAFLADNPAMRSDRGVNAKRVWDSNAHADSANDFVNLNVRPASAYTFRLSAAESAWDSQVLLPEAAGAVFCRNSTPPWAPCSRGEVCGAIHGLHHPETVVVRKVPEERYYTATIATTSGCASAGGKGLSLADGWPVATDADDELEPFIPDGGHPGPFATRFILQRIFEARQEAWFEPVENMVPNGRMEHDCRASGWTASSGVLQRASYDPLAWDGAQTNGGGAVVGSSCKWTGQAGSGATLASEPIQVDPGRVYFIRWFQRALATSKALGLRVLQDSDGDGTLDADICGSYPGGACSASTTVRRLDHPDLLLVQPSDPDGAGPMPPGLYGNDDARSDAKWCGDWCWLLLRIEVPANVQRVGIEFVAEGSIIAGIDELVMFPALGGSPDANGMTWLIPPGQPRIVATGDSRCSSTYSDWDAQFPAAFAGVARTAFEPNMTTACLDGQSTRLDLTKAVGCSDGGCGGTGETYDGQPDPAIPAVGLEPTKVYPNWVITYLGVNDAKAAGLTGGLIDSFIAGAVDEETVTHLGAKLSSASTSFTVQSTSGFPPRGGRALIGDEMVKYFTLTPTGFGSGVRGLAGSKAAEHPVGTEVRNLSLQGLVRRNGARHIFLASHPWRGLTDGIDAKCSADPSAQDCSEWLDLATRELIERAH